MNNFISASCVSNIDNVDASHITCFACRPEIGDRVEVYIDGATRKLEICGITHKSFKTHNGIIPHIEVELTTMKSIL